MMNDSLLDIQDLKIAFDTDEGRLLAVDGVSFSIRKNEVLGLVGESGCGKSVTALGTVRLIPNPPGRIEQGRIFFHDQDILALSPEEVRKIRGNDISMIFQDPMTALSPLMRVGAQLEEVIRIHRPGQKKEARAMALEWLKKVGIPEPERNAKAYPYELSGGMQQRVMIAIALMLDPEIVIADEPTTALDVTISAQIFDILRKMRGESTSVLLITHDLGVVWELCDRVIVMYAGKIVEEATVADLFQSPAHPYTRALLKSVPVLMDRDRELFTIEGSVPSPLNYPAGCRFHDRCPSAFDRCRSEEPKLESLGDDRRAACFLGRKFVEND